MSVQGFDEEFDTIRDSFSDFYSTLLKTNRFISAHPFLDRIKDTNEFFTARIKSGYTLYRARKCTDKFVVEAYDRYLALPETDRDTMDAYFYGYNEKDSMPPDSPKFSRANPDNIRYLYAASNPETAMVEVRPLIGSSVSLAVLVAKEDLKIIDYTPTHLLKKGYVSNSTQYLWNFIRQLFSTPTDGDIEDYLPSQRICGLLMEMGFKGVAYESSLNRNGVNFVIFDPDKFKPVSSKIYCVSKIVYTAESIVPENDGDVLDSEYVVSPSDKTPSQTHPPEGAAPEPRE